MNLPLVFYRTCYVLSALFFLVPEILALIDPDPGDTLTENVRPVIQSNSFLTFMIAAVALWLLYHFVWEGR